jgi:hypothetical protein
VVLVGAGIALAVTRPWEAPAAAPAATQVVDAGQQGGDAGRQGGDAGQQGGDAGQKGADADGKAAGTSGTTTADEFLSSKEKAAKQSALAAGKQILTGTVKVTTRAQRAADVAATKGSEGKGIAASFAGDDDSITLLMLDSPTEVEAQVADGSGSDTRTTEVIRVPSDCGLADGDHAMVASRGWGWWPTDVAGVLYGTVVSASDGFEVIAPQRETVVVQAEPEKSQQTEAPAPAPAPAPASSAYVLPDSASRVYGYSELNSLSTYDLYLARNEIYARHGRGFVREDLQEYFGSQGWYRETISPSDFSDGMLSGVEQENIANILAIEQSRNSPYL